MLAPNGAGSSVDTLSRIIGARSSEVIGQRIIIDNRAGARRAIGTEIAKAPDGISIWPSSYTVMK